MWCGERAFHTDGPTDTYDMEIVCAWSVASLSREREVCLFLCVVLNGLGIYDVPSVTFSIESSNNPMVQSEEMAD